MLRRIWDAIASWFRRLLGQDTRERRRRRASLSSATATQSQANIPPLGDADYEFLLMQLLEGVAHSWPKERVAKFLGDLQGRITDEQWTNWLRRFGERLVASPAPNNELATRMVRLGELSTTPLGNTAYEIGMQLLLRETRPPVTVPTPPPPLPIEAPIEEEEPDAPQPVTLEELFDLLQQDQSLVQQIAAQLQIDATDPQAIIQELINKSAAMNQTEPDTADGWFNLGVQQQTAGDAEGAIASYDRSLEIDPHASAVWSNRGVALADLGRYEEAIATFERVLQIEPTSHWAWNNRGQALAELRRFEDAIASFNEGLKYIQPTTQPEGWGQLHRAKGNAYYDQGRWALYPHEYWRKAISEYELALNTLTRSASPLGYLQVLQDLMRVLLSLGEIERSPALGQQGSELLQSLIEQEKQSGIIGIPVLIQSIGFHQLMVDLAVQSGQLTSALQLAEQGKNACFNWFLGDWLEQPTSPTWDEMQQLLNPSTAIIYWHLSPAALTTFILQPDAPQPISIATTAPANGEELPMAVQRLRELDNWVQDWNQQYEENRHLEQQQIGATPRWRDNLIEKLNNLAIILNIPEVIAEIPANVNNLILIPHRDLHRLPLHALFPEGFTVSYLPSAQIGLTLKRLGQIAPPPSDRERPTGLLWVEGRHREGSEALLYSQIEGAGVTQMFDNATRIDDAIATKQRVVTALASGYGIFHYTGKASDRPKTPGQSALALTQPDQLTLEDINRLYLNSYQLAYLSAGETVVVGKSAIATESVGLVSAFLSRGVTNIVSTLWTVEAISRALLTIEFYRLIKVGIAPAAALKQAQQWLRVLTYSELAQWYQDLATQLADYAPSISEYLRTEANILQRDIAKMSSSQPPFAHPYHWAAFTISGI
jgi:CHAT domain-containing protein